MTLFEFSRIMANLKSQRGEFEDALAIIEQAMASSDDAEGRLTSLKELIEERRDAATEKATDSSRVI